MATTKSKSLTIHWGEPSYHLGPTTLEKPPQEAYTAGHCCVGRRGDRLGALARGWLEWGKAPQLIELNISFQIFTFFTSFLGAFQYFTFSFFFFWFFLQLSVVVGAAVAVAGGVRVSIGDTQTQLCSYSTLGCAIWIWMEMILLDFHIFIMLPGILATFILSPSVVPVILVCCFPRFFVVLSALPSPFLGNVQNLWKEQKKK